MNYESLMATALSMEQAGVVSATLQASHVHQGGEEYGELVSEDKRYMVMPGAVVILEVEIKIGLAKALIFNSAWTLNGTMIDLEQAVQTPSFSRVPTKDGPHQRVGGKDGLSAGKIMVAWVGAPESHKITATGTYLRDGNATPFAISATVILLPAPVTAGDASIVGEVGVYPYEKYNSTIYQALGFDPSRAPNVGLQWQLRTGEDMIGTSGFVQVIRSREYSRVYGKKQSLGTVIKDENILDGDGIHIFYPNASGGKPDADIKIGDGPFVGMEYYVLRMNQRLYTFWEYKCKETKRTYLTYQALKGPVSIAAFVVGASYQDWKWDGTARRKESDSPFLDLDGGGTLIERTNSIKWMPLEWSANIHDEKYQQWDPWPW